MPTLNRRFLTIAGVVIAGFVVFVGQKAFAYSISIGDYQILGDVSAVKVVDQNFKSIINEPCSNKNSCPGACVCTMKYDPLGKISIGGTTLGKILSYPNDAAYHFFIGDQTSWTSYNFQENVPLFTMNSQTQGSVFDELGDQSSEGFRFTAYFTLNRDSCGISYQGNEAGLKVAENILPNKCVPVNPFCCCKLDGRNLADCRREVEVEYDDPTHPENLKVAPTCKSLGNSYKPFTAQAHPQYATVINEQGCGAFQDTVNKTQNLKDTILKPKDADRQAVSVAELQSKAKMLSLTKFSSPQQVIGQMIKILLSFIGSLALALYIAAGIMWMTSGGNAEKIDRSKSIFVWTTLGVVVMLASYFIVNFVFTLLNV